MPNKDDYLKQFEKERAEHPEFTDKQIDMIVGDHMREGKENEKDGGSCSTCKGTGKVGGNKCTECGGSGFELSSSKENCGVCGKTNSNCGCSPRQIRANNWKMKTAKK